jgi:hypothetical protein
MAIEPQPPSSQPITFINACDRNVGNMGANEGVGHPSLKKYSVDGTSNFGTLPKSVKAINFVNRIWPILVNTVMDPEIP